jgi:hypothetical protein
VLLTVRVELAVDERAELQGLVNSPDVPATVATRARIVLWRARGRQKEEIAAGQFRRVPLARPWTVSTFRHRPSPAHDCRGTVNICHKSSGSMGVSIGPGL